MSQRRAKPYLVQTPGCGILGGQREGRRTPLLCGGALLLHGPRAPFMCSGDLGQQLSHVVRGLLCAKDPVPPPHLQGWGTKTCSSQAGGQVGSWARAGAAGSGAGTGPALAGCPSTLISHVAAACVRGQDRHTGEKHSSRKGHLPLEGCPYGRLCWTLGCEDLRLHSMPRLPSLFWALRPRPLPLGRPPHLGLWWPLFSGSVAQTSVPNVSLLGATSSPPRTPGAAGQGSAALGARTQGQHGKSTTKTVNRRPQTAQQDPHRQALLPRQRASGRASSPLHRRTPRKSLRKAGGM